MRRVDDDAVLAVAPDGFVVTEHGRIGLLTDGRDDMATGDHMLGPRNGAHAAPPAGVRLGALHVEDTQPGDLAVFHLQRVLAAEEMELDALGPGGRDLFRVRRGIGLGAAIDEVGRARGNARGRAAAVHGHIAAADHDHIALQHRRGARFHARVDALKEVDAVFIAGQARVFAVHAEIGAIGATAADEDRAIAAPEELVHVKIPAQLLVEEKFAAHGLHDVGFFLERALGQTINGDAVADHAPRLGLGLENIHGIPAFQQVVGAGDAHGARAHNGHARLLAGCGGLRFEHAGGNGPVRRIAFEVADGDRRVHPAPAARAFAAAHTDPAATPDQRITAQDGIGGEIVMAVLDVVDIAGNIDEAGAGLDAGAGDGAVKSASIAAFSGAQGRGKMRQRGQEGQRTGLAHPAQGGAAHLGGNVAQVLPVHSVAVTGGGQRVTEQGRAGAAGRALAAGLGGHLVEVLPQRPEQGQLRIKNEKAPVAEERAGRIAFIEIVKDGKVQTGGSAVTAGAVIIDGAVPDSIDKSRHGRSPQQRRRSCRAPVGLLWENP